MPGYRLAKRWEMKIIFTLLAALGLGSCQRDQASLCAGVGLTLSAVRDVARLNWAELDEDELRHAWPFARDLRHYCEDCSRGEEFLAVMNCCEECEICPSLAFGSPSDVRALAAISVFTCPKLLDEAIRERDAVIDAMEPDGDALYEFSGEDSKAMHFGWRRGDTQHSIHTNMVRRDSGWLANITLSKCPVKPMVEMLVANDGLAVRATRIDVKNSGSGGPRLHVDYDTQCHPLDRRCVEAEARTLWPAVRDMAERASAVDVVFWAEGCGSSTAISYEKDENGNW